MPSLSEWQGAFVADVTNAVAQAKTYTDAQIGTLPAQVAANTSAITTNTTGIATTAASVASLSAGVLHNPATAGQNMAGFEVTNAAKAAANTSLARLDQVGWQQIGATASPGGLASVVIFTLPLGYTKFRVEWSNLVLTSSTASLIAQISTNGGSTFDSAAHYSAAGMIARSSLGTIAYYGGNAGSSWNLSGVATVSQSHNGFLEYDLAQARLSNVFNDTTGINVAAGVYGFSGGLPNAISIGSSVVASFVAGQVRLLGWKYP